MSFGKRFGELVRKRRAIEGMTQQELAEKVYDDPAYKSHVSKLENGHVDNPQAKTVDAFVVALNIPEIELKTAMGRFPLYVENLTDMFDASGKEKGVHIEVAVSEERGVVIITDCNIKKPIKRMEYFMDERELIFVGEDGMRRGFGMPLHENVALHVPKQSEIELYQVTKSIEDAVLKGTYRLLVIHDSA